MYLAELENKVISINTINAILTAPRNLLALAILLAILGIGLPSQAAEIIRDRGLIMSMPIQGVTLNLTPKQAFEHLTLNGFTVVNIARFEDWTRSGITFRKEGKMKPNGFPKWFIEISLGREGGRLINVSESSQKLDGTNYHITAEMEQVRRHFGIAEDERKCGSSKGEDSCSVVDGMKGQVAFSLWVRPTTKSVLLMIMPK